MRKLFIAVALVCFAFTMQAQDIVGTWTGVLSAAGTQLRVNFNITATDDGFTSTLDSPDQNAYGIPCTTTTYKKPDLVITVVDLGAEYKAKLKEPDVLEGTFTQMGQSFPLNMKKKKEE